MSTTNKYIIISGAFLLAVIFMSSPAFASSITNNSENDKSIKIYQVNLNNKSLHRRITGKVVSIDGNILSLLGKKNVVYSVDISSAKIMKSGTSIVLENVALGDTVAVVGVISGR